MTIEKLQERVKKAREKVLKCEKTVMRHREQLEKKKIIGDNYDIRRKEEDIEGSLEKLDEADRILENWKEKLSIAEEKERFLNDNAPQVIKDFLESWKKLAYSWYIKRYEDYQEFSKELEKEEFEARINCIENTPEYERYVERDREGYQKRDLLNIYPRVHMEKHLKNHGMDWRTIRKRKDEFAGTIVLKMLGIRVESERLEWLDSVLESEKKVKMLDLITRINHVVGKIEDASNLGVSSKGNLDGLVSGDKGMAKVETIGAGGYNIQCFHYRTMVHEVK